MFSGLMGRGLTEVTSLLGKTRVNGFGDKLGECIYEMNMFQRVDNLIIVHTSIS